MSIQSFHHTLNPQEARHYLPYAAASRYVYHSRKDLLKLCQKLNLRPTPAQTLLPFTQIPHITLTPDNALLDIHTGLRCIILQDPNDHFVITFAGTLFSKLNESPIYYLWNQIKANIAQAFHQIPPVYHQAAQITQLMINLHGPEHLILTGHSLGGGLAQYAGLLHNLPTICFNASPLGVGLQNEIGNTRIQAHQHQITHLINKGDWVADCEFLFPSINPFDFLLELNAHILYKIKLFFTKFGFKLRRNYGKKILVDPGNNYYFLHPSIWRHARFLHTIEYFASTCNKSND